MVHPELRGSGPQERDKRLPASELLLGLWSWEELAMQTYPHWASKKGQIGKEVALPILQRPHPSSMSWQGFGASPHVHLLVP